MTDVSRSRRPFLPTLTTAAVTVGLCLAAAGCATRGSGTPATETREIGAFERIEVAGAFDVTVHVDPSYSPKLELTADDNLLGEIETRVDGVELDVGLVSFANLRPKTAIRVEIWAPSLTKIDVSGATELVVEGLAGERFVLDVSGASDTTLRGAVDRLEIDISGAGELHARELIANQVEIDMSGAAEAEVFASERLDVELSGAGEVTYFGAPGQINQDISGAGSLEPGA